MTTEQHIKQSTKQFKRTSRKFTLADPNIGDISTRLFGLEDHLGRRFKIIAFPEKIAIQINIKTSLFFAINKPDFVCYAKKVLRIGKFPNKVYTNGKDEKAIKKCLMLIKREISQLQLSKDEGLFIYQNSIDLKGNVSREIVPTLAILSNIKETLELNFPEELYTMNMANIPAALRGLIPLLKEWAIPDDADREEKVMKSSKAKLKKIIEEVSPKMDTIGTFLDGFGKKPMTDEAILIGNLAELVAELMLAKR